MTLTSEEARALRACINEGDFDVGIIMAAELEKDGRIDDAESLLRELSVARFVPAQHNLAHLLEDAGRLDEAIAAYQSAIAEGYHDSLVDAGLLLEQLDRDAEASSMYETAIGLGSTNAKVNLGLLHLQKGRLVQAEELLASAAATDARFNWQLSDVDLAAGRRDLAAGRLQVAIDAGEPRAALDLAKLSLGKDEEETRTLFRQAIAADAIGGVADFADYLVERGYEEEALALCQDALKSGDPYVSYVIDQLSHLNPDEGGLFAD